jgi:conjugative relaxase-like TrwC/TraI family protein
MLHTSHPIGAATAGKYYSEHYSSAQGQYYTEGHELEGQWHGRFAAELGLVGGVKGEAFERLVNGRNPQTAEQWVRHRDTHLTASGKEMAHRAAWDLTFNAPKEVSLTALVGGDVRVREAHRAAVEAALDAGEMYTQARGGGDRAAVTTGKWIVAQFEHDTARPERIGESENATLYPAPHLHTHAVMMN